MILNRKIFAETLGILIFTGIFFYLIPITHPNNPVSGSLVSIPDEPIDYTIHIEAQIKPWIFNITKILDCEGNELQINASRYFPVEAGVGFPETVAYNTIELKVGFVYEVIFKALDTDHGFEAISSVTDYFGNPAKINLPQLKEISLYFKPTVDHIGDHSFSCNFYCGLGHGQMNGIIVVSSDNNITSDCVPHTSTTSVTSDLVTPPSTNITFLPNLFLFSGLGIIVIRRRSQSRRKGENNPIFD